MWLSYEDAAKVLNIKADSVRRQARLRSWPRRTGNDGRVQVDIPEDRLSDSPPENPTKDPTPDTMYPALPDKSGQIMALEARLEAAERRSQELSVERDHWRSMAEALRSDLAEKSRLRLGFFDRIFRR